MTTHQLAAGLCATLSPDQSERDRGTAELEAAESQPGFLAALLQTATLPDDQAAAAAAQQGSADVLPVDLRRAACVYLKRSVPRRWDELPEPDFPSALLWAVAEPAGERSLPLRRSLADVLRLLAAEASPDEIDLVLTPLREP